MGLANPGGESWPSAFDGATGCGIGCSGVSILFGSELGPSRVEGAAFL